jgi:aldose 1-epimerase
MLHAASGTTVTVQPWGQLDDGRTVELYTIKSSSLEVSIANFGGRIITLKTADRSGRRDDVVLGFDTLEGYVSGRAFFGTLVGRFANRIAHGQFTLTGKSYQLAQNNNGNSLHGGNLGFDRKLWLAQAESDGVTLRYVSPDGEEGYPGTLTATVRYSLRGNELRIDYEAVTDQDTIVNLTNHSFFNLTGNPDTSILQHQLTLYADRFTPADATGIPTGELRDVTGTYFDFRRPHAIGERIDADDEQLRFGHGYDHNWVLRQGSGRPTLAAEVYEPTSGRVMQVLTTQPGVQLYTGNFLNGSAIGKQGKAYQRRAGFCLETQHFPDSPNHPGFPSTELRAGQRFQATTVFRFTTRG